MPCSNCNKPLPKKEFNYSIKKYGKILCRECQENYESLKKKHEKALEKSTDEAIKIGDMLRRMGYSVTNEKWDKHKHIDLAIPELKVNLEIDGPKHNRDKEQALADLKRLFYSFEKGYITLHLPNSLTEKEVIYETGKFLKLFLEERRKQLNKP